MTAPQPYRRTDRRHPHVSHEELRRHLLAADEERYRLRSELREREPREGPRRWAGWPQKRRRVAVGIGTVLVTGLVGGLAWEMCPSSARAGDRQAAVQVVATQVTPQILVSEPATIRRAAAKISLQPRARVVAAQKPQAHAASAVRRVERAPRRASVPRPLSPGEFGRPRLAAY
jgi:hypothetical protein